MLNTILLILLVLYLVSRWINACYDVKHPEGKNTEPSPDDMQDFD